MPQGPAPANPGRDEDPAREPREPVPGPDPVSEEEWLAWCAATAEKDEPPDPDEEEADPDGLPGPWEYDLARVVAECRRITADEAAACARATRLGLLGGQPVGLERRGPGQPGSARRSPGEHFSRAAGFATGALLDTMPGCNALAGFAAEAAGDDDRYAGASDDEVAGVICAWDRLEAHMAARKHAAVAEFIRRRPESGHPPAGPAQMPPVWDEFTADELRQILAESGGAVEDMLALAHDLAEKLPGTMEAFRDGILRQSKAWIIARATDLLVAGEAPAAEAMVLDRAGRLTPAGLRAAIARAVMEVAPEKARKRREEAARDARVERWAEDSGNAALMGRELPLGRGAGRGPEDHRVGAAAEEGRPGGLDGRAAGPRLPRHSSGPGLKAGATRQERRSRPADGKPDAVDGGGR